MSERAPKSGGDKSEHIDEKHRQYGNVEHEHTGEPGEREPQAPVEGPSRRSLNQSDDPGEVAENLGLDQTFATGDEAEDEQPARQRPDGKERRPAGR
jgi:hypothetical protein